MQKLIIAAVCLFLMSGCAKAKYIKELLTLKKVGDEQLAMAGFVDQQNSKFEFLLKEASAGKLSEYKTRDSVINAFGKPIFAKKVSRNGMVYEKWLYRYSTQFFGSSKVIFYIDDVGNVESWEEVDQKKKNL